MTHDFFSDSSVFFDSQPGAWPRPADLLDESSWHEALRKQLRRRIRAEHPDRFAGDPQRRRLAELRTRQLIQQYERLRARPPEALFSSTGAPATSPGLEPTKPRSSFGSRHGGGIPSAVRRRDTRSKAGAWSDGSLPKRPLALGQLLCHLGWLSPVDLFHALDLHGRDDKRVGLVAESLGWLSHGQVLRISAEQKPGELFGQCAMRLGVLSAQQVVRLVTIRKALTRPLGTVLVALGLVDSEQLRSALEYQKRHNESLSS